MPKKSTQSPLPSQNVHLVNLNERNWAIATDEKRKDKVGLKYVKYADRISRALELLVLEVSQRAGDTSRIEQVLRVAEAAKASVLSRSRQLVPQTVKERT